MISFENIKAGFNFKNPAFFRSLLKQVVSKEGDVKIGELRYIFCSDDYLLEINKKYLDHDTYTDIITFPSSVNSEKIVSGEIYVSIDRVKENTKIFNHSFQSEFSRVLVHGLLHLLGYNDTTPDEKTIMRQKEDYYLALQPQKNS